MFQYGCHRNKYVIFHKTLKSNDKTIKVNPVEHIIIVLTCSLNSCSIDFF